jgi:REP element-mobilizing transposase RayT
MARGNAGQHIFVRREEWELFLDILAGLRSQTPFRIYAYCLMSNHFHLLIRIEDVCLSDIMQRLLGTWARRFNVSHSRVGHLFQGRYHAILCKDDVYLKQLIRYIHMNPVAAGIVERPDDWPWSGHLEYFGRGARTLLDRVWGLSLFSSDPMRAITAYERFLLQSDVEARPAVVDRKTRLERFTPEEVVPRASVRPEMAQIADEALSGTGLELPAVTGKRRSRAVSAIRRSILRAAYAAGYSLVDTAVFLGISQGAASRALAKSHASQESKT